MKNSKLVPIKESLIITVGEVICSAVVCLAFLVFKKFDLTVLLGTVIGSAAMILNFLVMSIAVNRAIDLAFAERGNYVDEPSDTPAEPYENTKEEISDKDENDIDADNSAQEKLDAAMRFANEQSARVNRIAKVSYIVRTASMVAILVIALITKWFHPLATVIPMLMFRPLIMAEGLIRQKAYK